MISLFWEHGWEIYDNRCSPRGAFWVIAGEEEFKSVKDQIYQELKLSFHYSPKISKRRGNKPGWWMMNRTANRGKKSWGCGQKLGPNS